FRDNPPLSGMVTRGRFIRDPADPLVRWPPGVQRFVWEGIDVRFDRLSGRTFRDERNPEGQLGVAPVGNPPRERPIALQWHTNGLQLSPKDPESLHMQERVFQGRPYEGAWIWQDLEGTNGSVVLDASTLIVGVHVIVVTEPGGRRPNVDRTLV